MIDLMSILGWMVFGLIVGVVVHWVDPKNVRGGIFGTGLIGILGALVGGFVASAVFGVGVTGYNVQSFVIAMLGALLFVLIQRAMLRGSVRRMK